MCRYYLLYYLHPRYSGGWRGLVPCVRQLPVRGVHDWGLRHDEDRLPRLLRPQHPRQQAVTRARHRDHRQDLRQGGASAFVDIYLSMEYTGSMIYCIHICLVEVRPYPAVVYIGREGAVHAVAVARPRPRLPVWGQLGLQLLAEGLAAVKVRGYLLGSITIIKHNALSPLH